MTQSTRRRSFPVLQVDFSVFGGLGGVFVRIRPQLCRQVTRRHKANPGNAPLVFQLQFNGIPPPHRQCGAAAFAASQGLPFRTCGRNRKNGHNLCADSQLHGLCTPSASAALGANGQISQPTRCRQNSPVRPTRKKRQQNCREIRCGIRSSHPISQRESVQTVGGFSRKPPRVARQPAHGIYRVPFGKWYHRPTRIRSRSRGRTCWRNRVNSA